MEKKKKSKEDIEFEKKFAKYNAMLGGNQQQEKGKKTSNNQKMKNANNAQRAGKKVEIVNKGVGNKQNYISNVGQLLNEDVEIKEIPREIAIQVQQMRQEKKLTQEQLAVKISEPVSKIKDLEARIGDYDAKLVNKIEQKLGVKFDRSWKK